MDYALSPALRWPLKIVIALSALVFLTPLLLDGLAPDAFEAQRGFVNNMLVQGPLTAVVAWLALRANPRLAWLALLLGIWLALSPLVYLTSTLATWAAILLGAAIALLSYYSVHRFPRQP